MNKIVEGFLKYTGLSYLGSLLYTGFTSIGALFGSDNDKGDTAPVMVNSEAILMIMGLAEKLTDNGPLIRSINSLLYDNPKFADHLETIIDGVAGNDGDKQELLGKILLNENSALRSIDDINNIILEGEGTQKVRSVGDIHQLIEVNLTDPSVTGGSSSSVIEDLPSDAAPGAYSTVAGVGAESKASEIPVYQFIQKSEMPDKDKVLQLLEGNRDLLYKLDELYIQYGRSTQEAVSTKYFKSILVEGDQVRAIENIGLIIDSRLDDLAQKQIVQRERAKPSRSSNIIDAISLLKSFENMPARNVMTDKHYQKLLDDFYNFITFNNDLIEPLKEVADSLASNSPYGVRAPNEFQEAILKFSVEGDSPHEVISLKSVDEVKAALGMSSTMSDAAAPSVHVGVDPVEVVDGASAGNTSTGGPTSEEVAEVGANSVASNHPVYKLIDDSEMPDKDNVLRLLGSDSDLLGQLNVLIGKYNQATPELQKSIYSTLGDLSEEPQKDTIKYLQSILFNDKEVRPIGNIKLRVKTRLRKFLRLENAQAQREQKKLDSSNYSADTYAVYSFISNVRLSPERPGVKEQVLELLKNNPDCLALLQVYYSAYFKLSGHVITDTTLQAHLETILLKENGEVKSAGKIEKNLRARLQGRIKYLRDNPKGQAEMAKLRITDEIINNIIRDAPERIQSQLPPKLDREAFQSKLTELAKDLTQDEVKLVGGFAKDVLKEDNEEIIRYIAGLETSANVKDLLFNDNHLDEGGKKINLDVVKAGIAAAKGAVVLDVGKEDIAAEGAEVLMPPSQLLPEPPSAVQEIKPPINLYVLQMVEGVRGVRRNPLEETQIEPIYANAVAEINANAETYENATAIKEQAQEQAQAQAQVQAQAEFNSLLRKHWGGGADAVPLTQKQYYDALDGFKKLNDNPKELEQVLQAVESKGKNVGNLVKALSQIKMDGEYYVNTVDHALGTPTPAEVILRVSADDTSTGNLYKAVNKASPKDIAKVEAVYEGLPLSNKGKSGPVAVDPELIGKAFNKMGITSAKDVTKAMVSLAGMEKGVTRLLEAVRDNEQDLSQCGSAGLKGCITNIKESKVGKIEDAISKAVKGMQGKNPSAPTAGGL